jgi:hypothetical protein
MWVSVGLVNEYPLWPLDRLTQRQNTTQVQNREVGEVWALCGLKTDSGAGVV